MKKKSVGMIMVANTVEYFQNTVYGIMLVVMGRLFFPSDDPYVAAMASAGAFAAGTLAHPIGAALIGYIGDVIGRKKAMVWCMILVTVPSFIIAALPTYDEIGLWAPLILLASRVVQGISMGGESQSSAVYVYEQAPAGREYTFCATLVSSSFFGILLASTLGAVMNDSDMPSWSWRVPFVVGGFLGIIAYILRNNLPDSSVEDIKEKAKYKFPLMDVFKYNTSNFLKAIAIYGTTLTPFYLVNVYLVITKLPEVYGLKDSEAMGINSALLLVWLIALPICGRIADAITGKRMLQIVGVLIAVCILPVFHIFYDGNLTNTIIAIGVYSVIGAGYMSSISVYINEMYKTSSRCSGVDMSTALGSLFFGAPAINVAIFLVNKTELNYSPAFYTIGVTLISIWAVSTSKHYSKA